MRGNPAAVLAEIEALLGPSGIITEPSEKAGYERGARYGAGRAACVVRPKTTVEVQQVVRWAHRNELQLIPQGANTGLVAAASPDSTATQVIVSLERMRSEIALDVENRTVTVSAGVLLQSLNERRVAPRMASLAGMRLWTLGRRRAALQYRVAA